MPRVRWAQRCRAHRSDGTPCTAWSLRGAYVCGAHGGSLRRTRQAAVVRLAQLVVRRAADARRARWQRQVIAFHAQRILVTADLMGLEVDKVTEADVWECRLRFGVPAASWEAPKLRDMPVDRRFLAFFEHGGAEPKPRKVREQQ